MAYPLTPEEFLNRRDAFLKSIGFDYQFGCYLYYLLKEEELGTRIEYETHDDITLRYVNGNKRLVQVKHTINKNDKMTSHDTDFWKSIETWLDYYNILSTDCKANFLSSTEFAILTNKELDNDFMKQVTQFKNGVADIETVLKFIDNEINTTSYKRNSILIKLKALKKIELRQFLIKLSVIDCFEAEKRMYNAFTAMTNSLTKSDEIVCNILGRMTKVKAEKANAREHLSYTRQEFLNEYKQYWAILNDESLEMVETPIFEIPSNYRDYPFIQQLEDIKVINSDDITDERLNQYMTEFYGLKQSLHYYESTMILTPIIEVAIEKKAVDFWRTIYNRTHRTIINAKGGTDNDKVSAGQDCFDQTTEKPIVYKEKIIGDTLSRGWYLSLSNDCRIVWHCDWNEKLNI